MARSNRRNTSSNDATSVQPVDVADTAVSVHQTTTFESVFATEYSSMVALAAAVSGSRQHAEDIAQEAMTRLDQNWAKVQNYGKPGAWLRRVTINLSLSTKRRLRSEAKALLRVGAPDPTLPPATPEDDGIWALVAGLSKKQRAVVALHFLEDRSLEEIAEILEISPSTARVHLHRAKQSLHQSLSPSAATGNRGSSINPEQEAAT